MTLSYKDLLEAVAGAGVGVRARTPLEPLGGPDDKVFPPTYSVAKNAETVYALEQRRVAGETVEAAVLDSVQSQANHFEAALLEAHRCGEVKIPLVSVDFREADGVEGSTASARWRPRTASSMRSCETACSTACGSRSATSAWLSRRRRRATPRRCFATPRTHSSSAEGLHRAARRAGAKYERALTSEIVATGVVRGKKTSSRIDPLDREARGSRIRGRRRRMDARPERGGDRKG